ncbi:hypothetical protein SVIO_102810 [Streptomyces violaceusniger]|uniref:Uncharacterized protein n=1 Tax=Streptomyces violaceusniger TaxID=68280 RepID=A0A4D4LMJ6_STRVO|nr:hypothetical protein SVIO_102810 [Streptomyces violaceusniger]
MVVQGETVPVHQPLRAEVVPVQHPRGSAGGGGVARGRSGLVKGKAAESAAVSKVRRIRIRSRPMGRQVTQPCRLR